MNVVYRGVQNPMTISIPGVQDSKVKASAPGLRRVRGSKYNIFPSKGTEVKINVSGTLPDGKRVSSVSTFRIKEIPKPAGYFRGKSGSFSIPKSSLERGTVEARLEDFDFDLPLETKSFRFRAPGQTSIVIAGNRLNNKAKSMLSRIKNGQTVSFFLRGGRRPVTCAFAYSCVLDFGHCKRRVEDVLSGSLNLLISLQKIKYLQYQQ